MSTGLSWCSMPSDPSHEPAGRDARTARTTGPRAVSLLRIEAQIIRRLAEQAGKDPRELAEELHGADGELPLDPSETLRIVPYLESDFGVVLPPKALRLSRLVYGRQLARLIQRRVAAAERPA